MKMVLNRIYRIVMISIIVSGLIFIILWALGIVTVVRGHGPSMEPTLADGEVYLQVKTKPENIKRGDIIGAVLEDGTRVTKRVIGLPGEHICCCSSNYLQLHVALYLQPFPRLSQMPHHIIQARLCT